MNYNGKKVEMYPVSSSMISEVGYDESTNTVFIKFNSNALYMYEGVCKSEFENLKTASSVGTYFNNNFKDEYSFERLK